MVGGSRDSRSEAPRGGRARLRARGPAQSLEVGRGEKEASSQQRPSRRQAGQGGTDREGQVDAGLLNQGDQMQLET